MRTLIVLAYVLLFVGTSYAWEAQTYYYLADQVLGSYYPHCANEMKESIDYILTSEPNDPTLGEPVNLHCDVFAGVGTCPAYDAYYCAQVKQCEAIPKASEWIAKAQNDCCCEQAKDMAAALVYHSSGLGLFHQMIKEDPVCQEEFEKAVSAAILSNPDSVDISYDCNAPKRTFTFKTNDLKDLVQHTTTLVVHEDYRLWHCDNCTYMTYNTTLGIGGECTRDEQCNTGYCDQGICCEGGKCCPSPGEDGYPCEIGQICSGRYQCQSKNFQDGFPCSYSTECSSGYCALGTSSGTKKYCCTRVSGDEACCLDKNDCLSGQECQNNVCKGSSTVITPVNNTTGNTQTNNTTPPIQTNGTITQNSTPVNNQSNGTTTGGGACLPFVVVVPALALLCARVVRR